MGGVPLFRAESQRVTLCGIAGIVGQGARPDLAEEMIQALAHRGPDGSGLYRDAGVVLGHTRLSIIDLQTGDQPIFNEDKTVGVVFNGEIYNYRELRRDLQARGHRFATTSDTEVLAHLYEDDAERFLPRLDGIFAFALWDARRKRLLLARDYFGVKPLHYHYDGATLRFASEAKAILLDPAVPRRVNWQSLHYFLNLRYIPTEDTLFENIKRLPPAHYLTFADGAIEVARYADFTPRGEQPRDEREYVEGIRHYLREAVRKQLVSDVPLGVYLSGGLDSSALVAMMRDVGADPIRTFTMGFGEPTDELADARVIAQHFQTEHHEIILTPDPLRDFPRVIWHAEEPKENILQGYLLSRFARQSVKVVLGGLGGDELFAGYDLHRYIYPAQAFHRAIPRAFLPLLRALSRAAFTLENRAGELAWDEYRRGLQLLCALGDPERYYLILRNAWDWDAGQWANVYGREMRARAFAPTHRAFDAFFARDGAGALGQTLWAEFNTKMVEDFLANEDRTAMANGVEVRVPFLDRDLVRYAFSIPADAKTRGNEPKRLFRRALHGILPEHALRKKKWGFSFNPYYQFQKDLRRVAEQILTRERVERDGWFNYRYLRQILEHPPHPRLRWHYFFLWNVVGFHIWHDMFITGDLRAPQFELEAYC